MGSSVVLSRMRHSGGRGRIAMGSRETIVMGEKEDAGGKWVDPPKEVIDDALDRAVTLVKACGGSMDSLSFGAAWKTAYPTYDRDVFKGTTVTSFTKLLQKFGQDEIIVESTAKKEVKMYVLKDAAVREQLEMSTKMMMQAMEFIGDLGDARSPWSLPTGLGSRLGSLAGGMHLKPDNALSLPPDLSKYVKLSALVDDLEPAVLALENGVSTLPAKDAVTALHHLRRLAWQAKYAVQQNRLESVMKVFAQISVSKIKNLPTKSIALLLSSLSDRDNFAYVFEAASDRLQVLADEAFKLSEDPANNITVSSVFSAQAIAVIVNSFARAKRRDDKLFRCMSKVVQAMPASTWDAQAFASIANGFAWADVRPVDEPLFEWLHTVALQLSPAGWTPYAVGLAVSAYHRGGLLEGAILDRLGQLTLLMLKEQGYDSFREPHLLADVVWAFAMASEKSQNPDRERKVVDELSKALLHHLNTAPIVTSATKVASVTFEEAAAASRYGGKKSNSRIRSPSPDGLDARYGREASRSPSPDPETREGTPPPRGKTPRAPIPPTSRRGKTPFARGATPEPAGKILGPPKRSLQTKAMSEKEGSKALQKYRNKVDVQVVSKVLGGLCHAQVYTSPQLWTQLSYLIKGMKIQPWQGQDWGSVLLSFLQAGDKGLVAKSTYAPLFKHVADSLASDDELCKSLNAECISSLGMAFAKHDKAEKHDQIPTALFMRLCGAAQAIPLYKFTAASLGGLAMAFGMWLKNNAKMSSSAEAKAQLKDVLRHVYKGCVQLEEARTDPNITTKKARSQFTARSILGVLTGAMVVYDAHSDTEKDVFKTFADIAGEVECTAGDQQTLLAIAKLCDEASLPKLAAIWRTRAAALIT